MTYNEGYNEEVGPFVQFVTQRKARKEHKCSDCTQPITKGTVYTRIVQFIDGTHHVWKTHTSSGMCADYEEEVR